MKRVHVLEFEDLRWFPSWLRTSMTNLLTVLVRKLGVIDVLARLVARVLAQEKIERIVDLGSGGGGAMPELLEVVRSDPATADVRLLMTDLYPNRDAIETFNRNDHPHIEYSRSPVDATDLRAAPSGLETMVNSFHHMRPRQARAIVESASSSGEPILIYEMGANTTPFLVWCLTLPIALPIVALTALVLTLFVRPLTLRQVFFTNIIPLVPIFYAWDGQASVPRIYTLEDMDELLEGLESASYRWEKGHAKTKGGRNLGIYLLGLPTA